MSNKFKEKNHALSDRLFEIRKKTGKTQSAFAELMGLNRNTVARYEAGNQTPSLEVLQKYKENWNISYDFLIDGECIEEPDLYNQKIIRLINRLTNGEKQFVLRMLEQFIENKELLNK